MNAETIAALGRVAIGVILVATVPVLCLASVDVPAPLWGFVGVPLGYFYGKATAKPNS